MEILRCSVPGWQIPWETETVASDYYILFDCYLYYKFLRNISTNYPNQLLTQFLNLVFKHPINPTICGLLGISKCLKIATDHGHTVEYIGTQMLRPVANENDCEICALIKPMNAHLSPRCGPCSGIPQATAPPR